MSFRLALFCVLIISSISIALVDGFATAYFKSTNPFRVTMKQNVFDKQGGIAVAQYKYTTNITGWAALHVSTDTVQASNYDLSQLGFTVGYLEGCLTVDLMNDAFSNYAISNKLNDSTLPQPVLNFVQQQWNWMKQFPNDTYGTQVHALLHQVEGMHHGYSDCRDPKIHQDLNFWQVYTLTLSGDLEDLLVAISDNEWHRKPRHLRYGLSEKQLHLDCSGLVKILRDHSDLFVGHTTFNFYSYMLRVWKVYEMPQLKQFGGKSTMVSFSARPGDLNSKDDYYVIDSGLVVIETSLATINRTLYDSLTPQSLPCWVRDQLANRLSGSAPEWVQVFSKFNGGTHNNDWIIVDYNKFQQNAQNLTSDLVWRLEQMGPYIEAADVTQVLETDQIIPSFNVPYFPFIANVSGYDSEGLFYANDTRHKIFMRDHVKITSFDAFPRLMGSNNYQTDPLAHGDACNAISARCDLNANNPNTWYAAFGGIDWKVTSSHLLTSGLLSLATSSPTHLTQEPFVWSSYWDTVPGNPHKGMPLLWNFNATLMGPMFN